MKSPITGGHRSALLACASLCVITSASAQTNGTWIGDISGGNWSDAVNWDGGAIADGSGAVADFSTIDLPLGPFFVNLDSPRTIGTLRFGDTETFETPGTWTLDGAGTLTLAGSPVLDVSVTTTVTAGVLFEGTEGFTKQGSGEIVIDANNFAGLTGGSFVLKEGLVRLGGGQANLQNAIGDGTSTIVFEGGRLALNGNLGDNANGFGTFSNPIFVAEGQEGTLHQSTRVNLTSTLTGSGTLTVAVPFVRGDFSGNWSEFTGNINLVKDPSSAALGEFRLAGFQNQIFNNAKVHIGDDVLLHQVFNPPSGTGTQTIQAIGELSGTALGRLGGNPVNGRFVNWEIGSLNTDSEFAGVIQNGTGAARITKVGTGTLTLSGDNTYTGETAVNSGTLSIGNGGSTGSLAETNVTVAAGATLVFNRDDTEDSTYPGILAGDGDVIKRGSGRVSFTGVNLHTSGTTIEGGTLAIADDSGLGAPEGAVRFTGGPSSLASRAPGVVTEREITIASGVQGGLSTVSAGDSIEVAGTISGDGSLSISGAGLVALSSANTYTGGTVQSSGILVVSNVSGSATGTDTVSVNGGTLGGSGTISGAVTVASGATVKAGPLSLTGSGVGALTTGPLELAGGSTLHFEFANPSNHDKIVVHGMNGLATPGASVGNPILVDLRGENSPAKFATPGTYQLIQFEGSFTGNANDLFKVTPESVQAGQTYSFAASGGFITLTITGVAPSEWQLDGDGTWSAAANWINGVPDGVGVTAVFGQKITAPRTITLDSSRTVSSLVFDSPNAYTIAGTATLTLDGGTSGSLVTNIDGSHQITTPVQLSTDLELVFNEPGDSLTLEGKISGSSGISKSGPGAIVLSADNDFTGGLDFSGGSLSFTDGGLGDGRITINDASLIWLPGNTQDVSSLPLTFGDSPVAFDTNGNDVTLGSNFGGLGEAPFTKAGDGTLTIAADTTFVGDLTIAGGTLQLGNGGTTGSVSGDIENHGELVISRTDEVIFPNLISGTGSLVNAGPGSLLLSAPNTFSGTTSIQSGVIELLDPLALQNSTLHYVDGGGSLDTGAFTAITLGGLSGDKDLPLETEGDSPMPIALTVGGNNDSTLYTGVLSGTGSLIKVGTGSLTLGGAHTFTGSTAVNGGILELAEGSSIDTTSANVTVDGLLLVAGGNLTSNVQSVNHGGGTNGIRIESGSAAFNGGILSSQNDGSLVHVAGGILTATDITLRRTNNYGNGDDPSATAGMNGFVVTGGTATLSGSLLIGTINSSASALVDGGVLEVAGPIVIGNTTNNRWSMLEVRSGTFASTDPTEGIVLSPHATTANKSLLLVSGGTASVEKITFGAEGAAAGTGRVTVTAGELYVGSGGLIQVPEDFTSQIRLEGGLLGATESWYTDLPIETAGFFTIKTAGPDDTAHDIELAGFITGTGTLEKTGEGTLTLSGGAFYTGDTYIDAGTLRMDFPDFDDASTVEIASGAILHLSHGQNDVVRNLRINHVSLPPGIYGAVGSPEGVTETPAITGTGRIVVADGGDAFTDWIDSFPTLTETSDKAADADPDGDGLTNLEEFALDSDPTSGASSGKVRSGLADIGGSQALVITLPVRRGATFSGSPSKTATIDGVTYIIRGSNDLAEFDQQVDEVFPAHDAGLPALSDPDGWEYRTFRLVGDIAGATPRGPEGFLDIQIGGEDS